MENNGAFSDSYIVNSTRPDGTDIEGSKFYELIENIPEDLTADRIRTIECRWHGIRTLQELYLDAVNMNRHRARGANEADLDASTLQPKSVKYTFDVRQTQRFYKALTSYWLAMEANWLLGRSIHDTWEDLFTLNNDVHELWTGNLQKDFLDSLDLLEVYDFVYGNLVEHLIPNGTPITQWVGQHSDDFFPEIDDDGFDYGFFRHHLRLHLRSSDIIELLAMQKTSTKTGEILSNRSGYLQRRGVFDSTGGISLTDHPEGDSLDVWKGVENLESSAYFHLLESGSELSRDADIITKWEEFRKNWKVNAKWLLFWWADPVEKIESLIEDS